jgi:hypothetical protein
MFSGTRQALSALCTDTSHDTDEKGGDGVSKRTFTRAESKPRNKWSGDGNGYVVG